MRQELALVFIIWLSSCSQIRNVGNVYPVMAQIYVLVQDCSISVANALGILQSCTKAIEI